MSKLDFVASLQAEIKALSPFEISQRLRVAHGCVCIYQGDPDLEIEDYRGYMVRLAEKANRSPENPEQYMCVVSLRQSPAWQNLVWIKEILGILDGPEHWTKNKASLGHMIDSRETIGPHAAGTPPNVLADKNGFTLAVGCAVPGAYRRSLRDQRQRKRAEELESELLVPREFIDWMISPAFEEQFQAALEHSRTGQ